MTAYKRTQLQQSLPEAQEAKAKRQAVLARVRKQRTQLYKKTTQKTGSL